MSCNILEYLKRIFHKELKYHSNICYSRMQFIKIAKAEQIIKINIKNMMNNNK